LQPLHCVIANMPQQLLGDIVEDMVEECADIEIIKRVDSIREIQAVMAVSPVDLVVLGMNSADIPQSCLGLMEETPNVTIIGLVDDGRRLAAFLDNVGKNDILKIIRTFCRSDTGPES
jgi:hypothetical protein